MDNNIDTIITNVLNEHGFQDDRAAIAKPRIIEMIAFDTWKNLEDDIREILSNFVPDFIAVSAAKQILCRN